MPIPLKLCQRDKKWGANRIGASFLTIASYGCTLTSLSMASSFYGCYKSPAELAAVKSLFNKKGEILWQQIEKVFGGKIKFDTRYYVKNAGAIRKSIMGSPKTVVLLNVAHGKHWVFATGYSEANLTAIDPYTGTDIVVEKVWGPVVGSSHLYIP